MSRTREAARKRGSGKRKLKDTESDDERPAKRVVPPQRSRPPQTDYEHSVSVKDPVLLADHFAQTIRRHSPQSTAIEIGDRNLPTKAFRDTTNFGQSHIADHLPAYLEKYTESGKKTLSSSDATGSPHTLIVTSSGIRTADLVRVLRVYNTPASKVGKFIAKHMTLKDNVEYVQKTSIGIGVGTAARLKDLADSGAMKLDKLLRIVIDGSYQDEKKRTIFDMSQTFGPTLDFLNLKLVRSRYGADTDAIEILVF